MVNSATLADNDFRKRNPRFSGEAETANRRRVDGLSRFAANHGMTNAQVACPGCLTSTLMSCPSPGPGA